MDLARIHLDGTVHERLTCRDPYDMNPAWSPDGTQSLWERCGVGSGLFTVNADGPGRMPLFGRTNYDADDIGRLGVSP